MYARNSKLAEVASALVLAILLGGAGTASTGQTATDDEIRQLIIQESIQSYPGSCPCPYNVTRNGRRCGRRSAYSRPGGYLPLCYPSDVTDDMVRQYRERHRIRSHGK